MFHKLKTLFSIKFYLMHFVVLCFNWKHVVACQQNLIGIVVHQTLVKNQSVCGLSIRVFSDSSFTHSCEKHRENMNSVFGFGDVESIKK